MKDQALNNSKSKWPLIGLGVLVAICMGCYLHYVLADELAWWLRIFLMLMLLFLTSTLLAYVIYLLTVLIVEIRVKLEHLYHRTTR